MAKKILLIDDEADIVTIIKFSLENNGFEAITAYDGQEGYKKASELKPDLIILDVLMPKTFGDDLATKLKNDPLTKDIPILFFTNLPIPFLTGTGTDQPQVQNDRKGNTYLQKTCSEEELLTAIRQVLSKKQG